MWELLFTTAGNVKAIFAIIGQGNGGVGFAASQNFAATGSGSTLTIAASSAGTTGACHGISITGGTVSTTGGGNITLNGTGGISTTASHGINVSGTGRISTATGNGSISLRGYAVNSAGSLGLNIANSTDSIQSGSGSVTFGR